MRTQLLKKSLKWFVLLGVVIAVSVAWMLNDRWLPSVRKWAAEVIATSAQVAEDEHGDEHGDEHEGHDHAHTGHDESSSLELSDQARRNIGLTDEYIREIKLETFTRTMSVPAMVVERPGRTKLKVVAPLTGIVTDVNIIKGEAVLPGRVMFKVRLTHEEIVQAQTTFLKTLGELDVEKREIARLQGVTAQGVVAGKVLLERQYNKQKLEVVLSAYREALLLHGLSKGQVDDIANTRHLLSELQVYAPSLQDQYGEVRFVKSPVKKVNRISQAHNIESRKPMARPFIVQELKISKGEFVQAGDTLGVLADFSELYIEGRAFEHDAADLIQAATKKWSIQAVREGNDKKPVVLNGLKISYLDNQVEPESRALHFYVNLPNQILHDSTTSDRHRFLSWRFKPGQRMQLRVPVEQWKDRIILPVDAVAQQGAEYFVFQQNGDHFDRLPVHVEYQDQFWVVIANDGSLFPGDIVAFAGAHQMQMALKNKSGGAPDPHAGHNH